MSWRDILGSLHKLRQAESPDGKPPRSATTPKQKPAKPGTPKDKNRRT